MKKLLTVFIALIISCLSVTAQEVSFASSAPLRVQAGQRFQVQLTLTNAQGQNLEAPKFVGLKVLSGPNISRGSQYSNMNGVTSQSTTETYTYYVEAESGASKATVSSASIEAGGKKYTSKALTVEVLSSGASGSSTTQGGSSSNAQDIKYHQNEGVADDDVILRLELSKRSCYVGEAISAQLKLYMRASVSSINNPKYTSFSGLWTQEIEVPQNAQNSRVTINDKVYEGAVLRQWLLYPQRAGEVIIEPTTLDAVVRVVTRSSGTSLFDQFYGGGSSVTNVNKHLSTGTIKLNVEQLPAGAPVGLDPSVGDFSLSSELSDTVITANSAGSLKVTLSGSGDFPLMDNPVFHLPAEFEQYDTKTKDNLRSSLSGTTGQKEWEFPFIARSEGNYVIPPIEIAFFNPKTKKYTTLATPEYNLEVVRDNSAANRGTLVTGVNREDLKILSSDIHYIFLGERGKIGTKMLLYSGLFVMILVGMILAAVGGVFYLRNRVKRRADTVRTKTRKASKVALRKLKSAKKQLDSGNKALFFEEILRAMLGFVGDRYGVAVSELSKDRIASEFTQRGVTEENATEYIALIEECELARYAPSASSEMRDIYNRTLTIFDLIF